MSRAGGLKARTNGEQFEALIMRACERYRALGAAYILKTPEPMKPIRPLKGGQFVACYTKQAQPDFKGTLRGGRAVCFEAKHTASGRIEQSRVTPEQSEALDEHHALGALCFVLVSFRFEAFFRVPWEVWATMQSSFGKKSANVADLEPYRVDVLRFLDDIEEVANA